MRDNEWVRLLAYVTGLVEQRLLPQNEYLAAKNRILRSHLPARLRLSNPERSTRDEIGKRMGRKDLQQVASAALPDTLMAWYRRLIAQNFDGSKRRSYPGRPPITPEIEALIVRMAREDSGWGYARIVGALANLGHRVSDQTVGNVLRRYGIPPASKRCQKTTWKEFISAHMAVLTGVDFFTVEVLTWRGLATYYVLFLIQRECALSRAAGRTPEELSPGGGVGMGRELPGAGFYLAGLLCLLLMAVKVLAVAGVREGGGPLTLRRLDVDAPVSVLVRHRAVGESWKEAVRIFTFEACSSFTRVTACQVLAGLKPASSQGSGPAGYPAEPLVSYHVLPTTAWVGPPPPVICAFGAH